MPRSKSSLMCRQWGSVQLTQSGARRESDVTTIDALDPRSDDPSEDDERLPIYPAYFERQVAARCGLHALNNAIGYAFLDAAQLEDAADIYLADANSDGLVEERADHIRRTGWYSEAVLSYALRLKGHLFSLNLDNQLLDDTDRPLRIFDDTVRGVVVNMDNEHWVAFRHVEGKIWQLDSTQAPWIVTYDEFLAFIATYESHAYAVETRRDAEQVT